MGRVEVKVVVDGGEVKHYEFGSVDLAIVALGKMVGAPSAKRGDPAPAAAGDTTSTAASSAVPSAPVAPAAPTTRTRKPRADRGQPRGPYNKASATSAPGDTTAPSGGSAPAAPADTPPAAPSLTEAEQKRAAEIYASQKADDEARAALQAKRDTAAAAVPSDADIMAAAEKLLKAKGLPTCMELFARFGVTRGRDLKPEQRAEYVKRVDEVIAGAAV